MSRARVVGMTRLALALFLLLLVLSGCTQANEPVNEPVQPVVEDAIDRNGVDKREVPIDPGLVNSGTDAAPEESPHVLAAIDDAETFIEAVKARDADRLVQLLGVTMHFIGTRMDHETAETVIEGFATNFDMDSLTVTMNREGIAWGPAYGQYEFKLSDNRGENRFEPWSDEDRLLIRYEENGTRIFYNPYIRYFPFAGEMVSHYMELIQAEDADGLAVFLNPDDIVVPIWIAEETIDNYKQFLNGDSPNIRYLNRFFFVVANDRNEEHRIQVIFGDGLMGIRDEFIPEFQ
ncbi:MAG: hypothetical protein C6W55_10290 [Thermobacillus sp.]|uniref:Uncharacterized protein n=2 Tax=Paenibacillaceae TaxID=186822 RepID=L0EC66_THECK|nr:hypothetical protein Theco_1204 [Thermobacillus composti KWC4]REK55365.1 MAG: hypothetical protein C6W55_10290 [Thermobacillus sp.]